MCLSLRKETAEALVRENQLVFAIDSFDVPLARSGMDVVDEGVLVNHLDEIAHRLADLV